VLDYAGRFIGVTGIGVSAWRNDNTPPTDFASPIFNDKGKS
jgi:hypothetical protein